MTNIVIVEDKLKNGLDLARQFEELAEVHQELDVHVNAICFFYEDSQEKAKTEIENIAGDDPGYEIRLVSLYDFDDVMDEYMIGQEEPTIAIMDFMLESATDRGARGIPARRVNVRYTRRADDNVRNRIWFYTTGGNENIEILCDLFGQEHVLNVDSFKNGRLSLQLEGTAFMNALQDI